MVYRHKVRLISDQMFVRAIILGIEQDHIDEMAKLYTFDGSEEFYRNFLQWDDARFLMRFGDQGDGGAKSKQLLERLVRRNLLKRVFYAPAKEFSSEAKERLMAITKPEYAALRKEIEAEIAAALSAEFNKAIDPDFTILHGYQIKSVRETSRNDEASILVYKGPTMPGKFEDESVLFASINSRFSDEYVEVYAPVSWQDRAERTRKLNKVTPLIKEIIESRIPALQQTLQL